jgi:hypothetical protein
MLTHMSSYVPRMVVNRFLHGGRLVGRLNTFEKEKKTAGVNGKTRLGSGRVLKRNRRSSSAAVPSNLGLLSMLPKDCESYSLSSASVLIADVSGFTKLNEHFANLPPEKVGVVVFVVFCGNV